MKGRASLSVSIPGWGPAGEGTPSKRNVSAGLSPPTSPINGGPIGDIECQRREALKRRMDVLSLGTFKDADEDSDADALSRLVMEGLGDSWSEIRGDTAKALARHCEHLAPSTCQALLSAMLSLLEHREAGGVTWQILHGLLLGLLPLVHCASAPQQSAIEDACLTVQRHPRLPVREAARKCFGRLFSLLPEPTRSTDKVLQLLSTHISTSAASPAQTDDPYCLDGLLCCIGVVISAAASLQALPRVDRVVALVGACLGDASSVVRQSAGHTLVLLLRRLDAFRRQLGTAAAAADGSAESSAGVGRLADAIYLSLIHHLQDEAPERWPQHEACLLVGEEIVRSATLARLEDAAAAGADGLGGRDPLGLDLDPTADAALLLLLQALLRTSERALQHAAFELRRIGAQVLPPLVRAVLLFAPQLLDAAHGSGGWPATEERATSQQQPQHEGNAEQKEADPRQALFRCVLAAEACKVAQHLHETLHDADEAPASHRWALEVQGRHMEDEHRTAFHASLRRLASKAGPWRAVLEARVGVLRLRLGSLVAGIERAWGSRGGGVYSCDYIEALALYCAVLAAAPEKEGGGDGNVGLGVFTLPSHERSGSSDSLCGHWVAPLRSMQRLARASADEGPPARLLHSLMDPRCGDARKAPSAAAANRWVCEAVAPVVAVLLSSPQFLRRLAGDGEMAAVTAAWVLRALSEPLLLDRRPAVRRGLFEALPTMLQEQLQGHSQGQGAVSAKQLEELCVLLCEAVAACLAQERRWDAAETYQVSKLIGSCSLVLALARPLLRCLAAAEEGGGLGRAVEAVRQRLGKVRDRLVHLRPAAKDPAAPSCSTPGLAPVGRTREDDEGDGEEDGEEDDMLDEFSDWDEDEAEAEMSASESGLLACDAIKMVGEIDAALSGV